MIVIMGRCSTLGKNISLIDAKSSLILLLNDYKSYTNLKLSKIGTALLKIE